MTPRLGGPDGVPGVVVAGTLTELLLCEIAARGVGDGK
jgi:hypothetical protein